VQVDKGSKRTLTARRKGGGISSV